MDVLEPFQYFPAHASAFVGYGGQDRSQDPRYCFHTAYTQVRPGSAEFKLTLRGVKASLSELNVRIMAYRPGHEVTMASSTRLQLDAAAGEDVESVLRFRAIDDVTYALYGYLTEPAAVAIAGIEVGIRELDPPVSRKQTSAISVFAQQTGFSRSIKLLDHAAPSLQKPISQSFTLRQVQEMDELDLWPDLRRSTKNGFEAWRLVMPVRVLEQAGLLADGAKGLLVASPNPALAKALQHAGCQLTAMNDLGPVVDHDIDGAYDFSVLYCDATTIAESSTKLGRVLEALAMGGLAILVRPIAVSSDLHATRNDLQQLCLRLIGERHDVVRMSLPVAETQRAMERGEGAFVVVVRKFLAADVPVPDSPIA